MHQRRVTPQETPMPLAELTRDIQAQEAIIRQGGGAAGRERQSQLGRLTVRERLGELLDEGAPCFWNSGSGPPGRCIRSGATSRRPAS